MIGTDEMSATTGMDISETFHPEDITKTDFFDFVTAQEMGIGIDVGVDINLNATTPTTTNHLSLQQQQQQRLHIKQQHNINTNANNSNMIHDGGGGGADSGGGTESGTCSRSLSGVVSGIGGHLEVNCDDGTLSRVVHDLDGCRSNKNNSESNSDSTLQDYEFWQTDKDVSSRLDASMFEDLNRYCWQTSLQQQQQNQRSPISNSCNSNNNNNNNNNIINHGTIGTERSVPTIATATTTPTTLSSISISQGSGSGVGSVSNTDGDGQIYTITVLTGNESSSSPAWLKREPDANQLSSSSLDLDSLLGSFAGYMKAEYGSEDADATFSADDFKNHSDSHNNSSLQTLPSLVTAMSTLSGQNGICGGGGSDEGSRNLGQQFAQFQNNNNDWHMLDHNTSQNTAESLLRSALQGKGYGKGSVQQPHIENSSMATMLPPSSPAAKDDEMRRILFSTDSDSLAFADSSLNASQCFEDSPNNAHLLLRASDLPNGTESGNVAANSNNLMVDDMFLTLENAFSDDFEKIKRIANEVQQFCTNTALSELQYGESKADMLMQLSPASTTAASPAQFQQLQSPSNVTPPTLLAPATTTTSHHVPPLTALVSPSNQICHSLQSPTVTATTPTQQIHLKNDIMTPASRLTATTTASKTGKKYKRNTSLNMQLNSNNNNNNNKNINNNNNNINNNSKPNVLNQVNNNGDHLLYSGGGGGGSNINTHLESLGSLTQSKNNNLSTSSSGSSSSNSPPTNGSSSSSSSSGGGSNGNGGGSQRKERSLHYCSICSKGFKDKYSVNVHIRTHTGEKPFTCTLCGKSFRQKAHLAKHYQTHMTQKNGSNLNKGHASKNHRQTSIVSATAMNSVGSNPQNSSVRSLTQHRQHLNSPIPTNLMSSSPAAALTITNHAATVSLLGSSAAMLALNGGPTSVAGSNLLTSSTNNSLMANR